MHTRAQECILHRKRQREEEGERQRWTDRHTQRQTPVSETERGQIELRTCWGGAVSWTSNILPNTVKTWSYSVFTVTNGGRCHCHTPVIQTHKGTEAECGWHVDVYRAQGWRPSKTFTLICLSAHRWKISVTESQLGSEKACLWGRWRNSCHENRPKGQLQGGALSKGCQSSRKFHSRWWSAIPPSEPGCPFPLSPVLFAQCRVSSDSRHTRLLWHQGVT